MVHIYIIWKGRRLDSPNTLCYDEKVIEGMIFPDGNSEHQRCGLTQWMYHLLIADRLGSIVYAALFVL